MVRSDLCSRRPHDGGMGNGYFNCNSCSCVLRLACGGLVTDKNISSCEVIPALLVITCHYLSLLVIMLPLQHLVNTVMSFSTVLLRTLHVILFHRTLSPQPRWTYASSVRLMLTPTSTRTDS